MRLIFVSLIPERGGQNLRVEALGPHYKTYRSVVETFDSRPHSHARVMGTQEPHVLYRSLRTTLRRLGLADRVGVVKRGYAVYLDRIGESERERRADIARSLETALHIFSVDDEHPRVRVNIPEGLTVEQAYHSLHYRRTKNGYGTVRVIREGENIFLTKSLDI